MKYSITQMIMNSGKVYHKSDETNVDFTNTLSVTDYYNRGFVLTRVAKGNMIQTRSLRIDLDRFELNSENKRILKKNQYLGFVVKQLPLEDYSWEIHFLGKDFYTKRFGDGTMSASKIKEMFQEPDKSNMNSVFKYKYITGNTEHKPNVYMETYFGTDYNPIINNIQDAAVEAAGYCLCYMNDQIMHYAYPFYDLEIPKEQSLGIAMMTKAIVWAKESGKKYIYLGSVVEPSSKYKLQFEGIEWFDDEVKTWSTDLSKLKELLSPAE